MSFYCDATTAFVDVQGFIVADRMVAKEFATMRNTSIAHRVFAPPKPWDNLTVAEQRQATWLRRNHHGLR